MTTIETAVVRPALELSVSTSLYHGVSVRGQGGAIVTAEIDGGNRRITAIERFGLDVYIIAARVRELRTARPGCQVVVDADGPGSALFVLLGGRVEFPNIHRGLHLYVKRGPERNELTTRLLVAVARRDFSIAPGLAHEDALRRALLGLTKDVREDGPGSELAVALSLAVSSQPAGRPMIG
jgi:hypothetical protein